MTGTRAHTDAEIPLPRLRTISHLWMCAAVLASVGVAAVAFDAPVSAWVQRGYCPNFVEKLCGMSEIFGHGLGVVLLIITLAVLDPWHRFAIPRILAASLGSGLLANVFKLLVGRTRPLHFDLNSHGLDAFSGWIPLWTRGSWEQSFPSSHTAVSAGLAIVLAYYYPRGRWLFPVFAGLAAFERIVTLYHFTSDVFWGAAVGCIFAPLCVYGSGLSRAFDRLEARLLERSATMGALNGPHRRAAKSAHAESDVPRAA
jgi:membrane-associated phospholipid phosphatase